tara:strand:- start:574 stop:1287 length:714 start_codon:yes stop_codon:yes gene_type:complete
MINFPKAVIFDLDNTLYHYDPCNKFAIKKVSKYIKKKYNISEDNFVKAFNKSKKIVKHDLKNTASSHSRILYFQKLSEILFKKTKVKLSLDLEEIYWSNFLNKAKLFKGVVDFLKLLKCKNIKIGNLTDLTTQIQFKKLVYFNIDKYFDFVVTSEEVGKEKPNKLTFKLIIKKLNISPKDIWMIGDNPDTDLEGASKFELTKIQKIHSGVKLINSRKKTPDFTFKNYSQLISIIKKI